MTASAPALQSEPEVTAARDAELRRRLGDDARRLVAQLRGALEEMPAPFVQSDAFCGARVMTFHRAPARADIWLGDGRFSVRLEVRGATPAVAVERLAAAVADLWPESDDKEDG